MGASAKPNGLSSPTEPCSTVSALTGFDPSRLSAVIYDMVQRGVSDHIATIMDARDAFVALNAEIDRRDRNEHRNCINWGPCSRNDHSMSDGIASPNDSSPSSPEGVRS